MQSRYKTFGDIKFFTKSIKVGKKVVGLSVNHIAAMKIHKDCEKIEKNIERCRMGSFDFAIEGGNSLHQFHGETYQDMEEMFLALGIAIQFQYRSHSMSDFYAMERAVLGFENIRPVTLRVYVPEMKEHFHFLRNFGDEKFDNKKHNLVFARSLNNPLKATCKVNDFLMVEFLGIDSLIQKTTEEIRNDEGYDPGMNDVRTISNVLRKYKKRYKFMYKIPLTQNSIVRKKCNSVASEEWKNNCNRIFAGTSYDMMKKFTSLFQGGYINARLTGRVLKGVKSYDGSSFYPSIMVTKKFPVSEFKEVPKSEYVEHLAGRTDKVWFMKAKFKNICSKTKNIFWPCSKINIKKNNILVSGLIKKGHRVEMCDSIQMYMADLDWYTFFKAYMFEYIEIEEMWEAEAGYLDQNLIDLILEIFEKKKIHKNRMTKTQYREIKEFLNGIFGACVVQLIGDIIIFSEDGWKKEDLDEKNYYEQLEELMKSERSFTYQQGIWVTAWGRKILWDLIFKMDDKIVYCDTDSIKGFFGKKEIEIIEEYNKSLEDEYRKVSEFYNKDFNFNGIGRFELDGDYDGFKSLGPKCYATKTGKDISMTVAGLIKDSVKINSLRDFHEGKEWNADEVRRYGIQYVENNGFYLERKRMGFTLSESGSIADLLAYFAGMENDKFSKTPIRLKVDN